MSISVRAKKLTFDRDTMWVELDDGRSLGVPLAWFPRLLHATADQRDNYRIGHSGNGLHWDDLDEDISVEGLLAGRGDRNPGGIAGGLTARTGERGLPSYPSMAFLREAATRSDARCSGSSARCAYRAVVCACV